MVQSDIKRLQVIYFIIAMYQMTEHNVTMSKGLLMELTAGFNSMITVVV